MLWFFVVNILVVLLLEHCQDPFKNGLREISNVRLLWSESQIVPNSCILSDDTYCVRSCEHIKKSIWSVPYIYFRMLPSWLWFTTWIPHVSHIFVWPHYFDVELYWHHTLLLYYSLFALGWIYMSIGLWFFLGCPVDFDDTINFHYWYAAVFVFWKDWCWAYYVCCDYSYAIHGRAYEDGTLAP